MSSAISSARSARGQVRRAMINKSRRSRVKSFVRYVRALVASGDKEGSVAALRAAQVEIQRAASKGVIHHNAASRKISRLSRTVKQVCLGCCY